MAKRGEGFSNKPTILNIAVPEIKKIKLPTKYYVYKLIVEWSDGLVETVYRRYSQIFDFQAKLLDTFENSEETGSLPELPGKVLFGRSQVHQVAEKRRGKIEEFCQAVLKLPPTISESSLVQGFFSIWPDDIETDGATSSSQGILSPSRFGSFSSPIFSPGFDLSLSSDASDTFDLPINEEMPQYRAVESYTKKDSQQVNLTEGQNVLVIERSDTGWWMVLAGDEQGYAPASLLECTDGSSAAEEDVLKDSGGTEGLYEAVDEYRAINKDEVSIKKGDTLKVLNRSMDGWWEISSGDKTGLVPGTMIQKTSTLNKLSTLTRASQMYCKGTVVLKPPPRRNKPGLAVNPLYDIPRKDRLSLKSSPGQPTLEHNLLKESEPLYAEPAEKDDISFNQVCVPAVKDANCSSHQEGSQIMKKKLPLPSTKVSMKLDADSGRGTTTSNETVRSRSRTTAIAGSMPEDDYVKMHQTSPLDSSVFATGPRRKKKPMVSSTKQLPTESSGTSLRRMSRSHSFDDILNLDSSIDWTAIIEPPKTSCHKLFGDKGNHSNTGTNSKASNGEDQTDYIDLSGKPDSSVTLESFTAVAGYVAQSDICLSFSAGTCCVLLRKTDQNWWLVNIGGKEGWVPGSYWELSTQQTASKLANPPPFPAPKKPPIQPVQKRPLAHSLSSPASDQSNRPLPKPRSGQPILSNTHVSRGLQTVDEAATVTSSRSISQDRPSSTGNAPGVDSIPINGTIHENQCTDSVSSLSVDQPNRISPTHGRNTTGYEQRPPVPKRTKSADAISVSSPPHLLGKRSDVPSPAVAQPYKTSPQHSMKSPTTADHEQMPLISSHGRPEVKPLGHRPPDEQRGRAETVADTLATISSTLKVRSMTVVDPVQREHDYEEITNEIDKQAWYYGPMDRESAESLLKEHGKQSEFLVRERLNRRGYYALSTKADSTTVRHFNIDPHPANKCFLIGKLKFNTIFDVIYYYKENSLFLQGGIPMFLGQPVRRRF